MLVKKVLVVDDSATDREHLQDVLEKQNITVLSASSGQDALKMASAERPDIIFLDIIMSGMDGYAVCRSLRENENTKGIPIIFFTTGLHPDYHRVSDTVDKITFPKMARIAQLVYETGFAIANTDRTLTRDNKGPRTSFGTAGEIIKK